MKNIIAVALVAGLAVGAGLSAQQGGGAPAPQGGAQGQGGRGGGGGGQRGPQQPPGPPLIPATPYKPGIPEKTAQDTAITNVRIVVGNGQVIENGHIIIRAGKIATVAAGAPASTQGLRVFNAQGLSAMPGFIDGHKHLNDGPQAEAYGRSLLEAGYTTILVSGAAAGTTALAKRYESGELNGPRIIPSGAVSVNMTPDEARAAIRAMAEAGVKNTGEIGVTPEPAPPMNEIETLKAIVDEAKKVGVQVNVHAVSSPAMVAAIDAGVTRLVHLPNKDWTSYEQAARVAATGSIVAGLIAFGAPNIDRDSPPPAGCPNPCGGAVVWPRDNTTKFRNGQPWPETITGANRDAKGRATGTEAAYEILNARRIWDADPNHGTISYSTDQNFADLVVLEHELKSFSIVFSMSDIHRIMGPNSAKFVGMENQIGTLEPNKFADIILLSGNPTQNIYELLTTKVVFKEGRLVIDSRPETAPAAPARGAAPAAGRGR
ncbi:MAG: amidohydrolase family protein [Vicinamibacterales bacterium]